MNQSTRSLSFRLLASSILLLAGAPLQAFADFVQLSPSWGLDRLDQDGWNGDGQYRYPATGAGVHVYVLSRGIRSTHVEFGGRVGAGVDFVGDGFGPDGDPNNFYGTHVAGVVGGKLYGAAKNVILHSVRVANSTYTVDKMIAGIDWVIANKIQPAVLFATLTYTSSTLYDAAIQRALDAGITVVAPVANSGNADACAWSPAGVPGVLTVGAISGLDNIGNFSSIGSCVDIFAIGYDVYSAMSSSDTAIALQSSTGEAAGFVAGAAAIYLELHPNATSAEVHQAIISKATLGHINFSSVIDQTLATATPNRILRVDQLGSDVQPAPTPSPSPSPTSTAPANQAPVASFTASCRKAGCSFNASASSDDVGIASYSWSFGDGTSGSGVTASHTYAAKGTYNMTVTLTVTDGDGLKSSTQKSVTIKNGR